jgi:hypothetical protein
MLETQNYSFAGQKLPEIEDQLEIKVLSNLVEI